MPRPTREEIDDEILETAAGLFATHGLRETSVQRIADAVGYSKTGLLHRYPSKEALQQAVVDRAIGEIRAITAAVSGMPPGPERDLESLRGVARLALSKQGAVRLLLSALISDPEGEMGQTFQSVGHAVFELFSPDPACSDARIMRIIGALGALAVARIAMHDKGLATDETALTQLVEISYDALGHARPGAH